MNKEFNTTFSFSERVKGSTPVLVEFYADWCELCKMMDSILKERKNRMGDGINILTIDAEKNADAAVSYNVRGVPTLILFNEGQVLWQQSGVIPANQLQLIINEKTGKQ